VIVIPPTKNSLPAMGCLSAMQKCIRRNLEMKAMEFAVELIDTSKGFTTMVCNRLRLISHEDIDVIAAPWIVPFVHAATEQAVQGYDQEKPGRTRMPIGNCIRLMSRAPKCRQGDHFHIVAGLHARLEGFVPEIPDWANDGHTIAGKRLGRGVDYFRKVSALLSPAPFHADPYEAEAFRLLALKTKQEKKTRPRRP
jgi:replication-associated recombination protein RarA